MHLTKKQMEKNYIKNLKFFKKNFPEIHKVMKNYKVLRYKLIRKNGKVDIFDTIEKRYIYNFKMDEFCNFQIKNFPRFVKVFTSLPNFDYSGNKINEIIVKEVKNILSKYKMLDPNLIKVPKEFFPTLVVMGLGSGLILQKLINNLMIKKILIFEPYPDFFYNSLFIIDWEDIFSKFDKKEDVSIQIGINKDEDVSYLMQRKIKSFFSQNPILGAYIFVFQHYQSDDIEKAKTKIGNALDTTFKGWGFFEDEKEGFEHSMENLNRKSKVIFIDEKYKPPQRAFIVGSGPSLDKTIQHIKKYKDSALIFACGTAINPLVENGIIPDFLVELERSKHINDVLDTVDPKILKKIYLITPDVIHPNVPPRFKDVFYFIRIGTTDLLLNPYTNVPLSYPTVTNTALAIAFTMGIKDIYLFGVDLGFKSSKKTHASKTVYNKEDTKFYKKDKFDKESTIEGNFGGIVYSTWLFNWARATMEDLIFKNKDKGINVYNCSDGAKIRGTIPLNPANINISDIGKQEEIKKVLNAFVEGTDKTLDVKPFEKIIENIKFLKKEILKTIDKEIVSYEDLYYLLENLEKILETERRDLGISIFIQGTIRLVLFEVYVNLLKLAKSKDITFAYKEIKPVLSERFNRMLNKLEDLIKKYEKNYKGLYTN